MKASSASVLLHPEGAAVERFHIELSPGETRWVTEDEKWELRRVCPLALLPRPRRL